MSPPARGARRDRRPWRHPDPRRHRGLGSWRPVRLGDRRRRRAPASGAAEPRRAARDRGRGRRQHRWHLAGAQGLPQDGNRGVLADPLTTFQHHGGAAAEGDGAGLHLDDDPDHVAQPPHGVGEAQDPRNGQPVFSSSWPRCGSKSISATGIAGIVQRQFVLGERPLWPHTDGRSSERDSLGGERCAWRCDVVDAASESGRHRIGEDRVDLALAARKPLSGSGCAATVR